MNCLFPLCSRHAEANGYCIGHRAFSSATSVKVSKPIPKRSDKMKEAMKEVKKLYEVYLKKFPLCKLNMPGCSKLATCVHHSRGREGKQLTNQADWMPSCWSCNLSVEVNDGEARDRGLKKNKNHVAKG